MCFELCKNMHLYCELFTSFLLSFSWHVCSCMWQVTSSSQQVLSLLASERWSVIVDCIRLISSFRWVFKSCKVEGKDMNAFCTRPSADVLNPPDSLSSAAPSLSPCGRSPVPSQRCFALLGLAPDISESSAQTVQPALSARPDSLTCSDAELLGFKIRKQQHQNNSKEKNTTSVEVPGAATNTQFCHIVCVNLKKKANSSAFLKQQTGPNHGWRNGLVLRREADCAVSKFCLSRQGKPQFQRYPVLPSTLEHGAPNCLLSDCNKLQKWHSKYHNINSFKHWFINSNLFSNDVSDRSYKYTTDTCFCWSCSVCASVTPLLSLLTFSTSLSSSSLWFFFKASITTQDTNAA